jgi:hypothetical protein
MNCLFTTLQRIYNENNKNWSWTAGVTSSPCPWRRHFAFPAQVILKFFVLVTPRTRKPQLEKKYSSHCCAWKQPQVKDNQETKWPIWLAPGWKSRGVLTKWTTCMLLKSQILGVPLWERETIPSAQRLCCQNMCWCGSHLSFEECLLTWFSLVRSCGRRCRTFSSTPTSQSIAQINTLFILSFDFSCACCQFSLTN